MIFQDFVQLDSPIQRRVKGTGLGLPLSKKLAELLGGSVTVTSKLGQGSTFYLRIPLRYSGERAEAPAAPLTWVADPSSLPVLFVEDSQEMLLAYKSYLRGSGFQLVAANTTREAEAILERVRPQAIVLDIILRAEYSWDFLARLESNPATRDIPVLVLTTLEDQAKGYHLGAASYLVKPVDKDTLIRELRSITGAPPLRQVLIIDDNEMDRYLLKQQLRKLSILISEASSGNEGLRKARELKPAAIFLDLIMPDRSGFEILDCLKAETSLQHIPVVIVTSCILKDDERDQLLKKAVGVIRKDSLAQSDIRGLLSDVLKYGPITSGASGG